MKIQFIFLIFNPYDFIQRVVIVVIKEAEMKNRYVRKNSVSEKTNKDRVNTYQNSKTTLWQDRNIFPFFKSFSNKEIEGFCEEKRLIETFSFKYQKKLELRGVIGNLRVEENLYVLESMLNFIKNDKFLIEKMELPLDHFYFKETGELLYKGKAVKFTNQICKETEVQWIEMFLEKMKTLFSDHFQDFYKYYERSKSRNLSDIRYTLSLIRSYQVCSKIPIINKIILKNDQISCTTTSPTKNTFIHKKLIEHSSPLQLSEGKNGNSLQCRDKGTPKFLRKKKSMICKKKRNEEKCSKKQRIQKNKESLTTMTQSHHEIIKQSSYWNNFTLKKVDAGQFKKEQNLYSFPFLPNNLEEVESQDQSEQEIKIKEFDEISHQINRMGWNNTIQHLFEVNQNNLKESFTDGAEEQYVGVAFIDKLKGMARNVKKSVITEL